MPLFARVALVGYLLCVAPLFGWWETGHRTVARVAVHHLTPAARSRIARILNITDTPEAVADALAQASTWADESKGDNNTGSWHYIDIALQDDRSKMASRCRHDDCVTARIRLFAAQLTQPPAGGRWTEADALRFLVHFVGDVHQPLHAVSDADLGGNCEPVDPPVGDAKNLHSLWDGEIVRAVDADDHALSVNLESYIRELGSKLPSDWSGGTADDWAWESHTVAIEKIYGPLHIPTEPVVFPNGCGEAPADIRKPLHIDTLYIDSMKPVMRDQLTKASLRLAKLLNETL